MVLYVQLWKVRTEWLALTEQERLEYAYQIGVAIKQLIDKGAELVGFSLNDLDTPQRTDYRYVAIWRLVDREMSTQIDHAFHQVGWNEYFENVNARGDLVPPQELLKHMIKL